MSHHALFRRAALSLVLLLAITGCRSSGANPAPSDASGGESSAGVANEPAAGDASKEPEENALGEAEESAATAPPAGPPPTKVVNLKGVEFHVPTSWVEQAASTSSRLAQYKLTGPAGDADLVVYYFGPTGAGDIEANVQRWLGEYTEVAESTKLSALKNKLFLTIIRIAGTYSPRAMAPEGQRSEPRPDTYTFAAIISGGPDGPLYMKAVGPIETVNARAQEIGWFLDSVRPAAGDGKTP